MVTIPGWITNVLLLAAVFLSIYQMRRLYRPNVATVPQFWIAATDLLLMLVVTFAGQRSRWLSLGLFIIAVACLLFLIRQQRHLPPPRSSQP